MKENCWTRLLAYVTCLINQELFSRTNAPAVFAKQGKLATYDAARVHSLVRRLQPTGNILLVRARDPEGRSIATGIYPGLNEVAYFWGNATWRPGQQWRPNETLYWYAIRYWKERGVKSFDWGGGGYYKEKYGVQPLSVLRFYKSRYRIMTVARNEARDRYYRSRKLIGCLRGVTGPAIAPQP